MTGSPLRWGLLSTSSIGETVLRANRVSEVAEFVAVASRDADKARSFADRLGLRLGFGSYRELLESDAVDAVYVALPVSMHTEWTVKALRAGKHVLCEKPFALSALDARRCADAAEEAGVACVEGLMYRHHPRTELARRLVGEGTIGEVTLVRGALSVAVAPDDIRRTRSLGGGALGDLGAYCGSAFRLFAGEPQRVHEERVLDGGADPVDLRMVATLRSRSGVVGTFDVGLDMPRRDEVEIIGTEGRVVVDDPRLCLDSTVQVWRDGACERHEAEPVSGSGDDEDAVYRIEFETVSSAIRDKADLAFGADDLVAQAALLESLERSAETGQPVEVPAQPRRSSGTSSTASCSRNSQTSSGRLHDGLWMAARRVRPLPGATALRTRWAQGSLVRALSPAATSGGALRGLAPRRLGVGEGVEHQLAPGESGVDGEVGVTSM